MGSNHNYDRELQEQIREAGSFTFVDENNYDYKQSEYNDIQIAIANTSSFVASVVSAGSAAGSVEDQRSLDFEPVQVEPMSAELESVKPDSAKPVEVEIT